MPEKAEADLSGARILSSVTATGDVADVSSARLLFDHNLDAAATSPGSDEDPGSDCGRLCGSCAFRFSCANGSEPKRLENWL
ncbi:hypothetical protein ACQZ6F_31990 [Rhizobium sp. A22-96]